MEKNDKNIIADELNNNDKLVYLQLIQEPICRMSTISAIFKGFAAAIVGGIAMISYSDISLVVLGLSFLPVFAFLILDIYYLKLERKFRYLYNEVKDNKHPIDYSLDLKLDNVNHDTISGFVLHLLGEIPDDNQERSVTYENLTFKITGVKGNRVTKIKLTIKKSEEKESDSSED